MKKKIFNQSTISRSVRTGHYVSVAGKSGTIKFSKDTSELLNLKKLKITLVQDADKPTDWYIEITKSDEGFPVRGGKIIQSTALCQEILQSIGNPPGNSIRMMINPKPDDGLFAIITKSAKAVTRKSKS